jgi:hypothetical protein
MQHLSKDAKALHFIATMFLGYRACAAGIKQTGDGYIGLDGELFSRIASVYLLYLLCYGREASFTHIL